MLKLKSTLIIYIKRKTHLVFINCFSYHVEQKEYIYLIILFLMHENGKAHVCLVVDSWTQIIIFSAVISIFVLLSYASIDVCLYVF